MIKLANFLLELYSIALITYVALSWFKVDPQHPSVKFLKKIVDPVLDPVRKVVPPVGGFDLSVIAVLFLIHFIRSGLLR
jgi:YggT family protein